MERISPRKMKRNAILKWFLYFLVIELQTTNIREREKKSQI